MTTPPKPPPGTYVLFDPHIAHDRITAWTNRRANFAEVLGRTCHATLKPGDHLIIGGDFYMGPRSGLEDAVKLLVPDGVHATLVLGNHDKFSERAYRDAGLHVCDGLVYRRVLITHHGSATLPDDVIAQIGGHYHQNPAHPDLPHHLKLSIEEHGLRPLSFDWIFKELQRRNLLRTPPKRLNDRWFLALPQHAQIIATLKGGAVIPVIPGQAPELDFAELSTLTVRGRPARQLIRALHSTGLLPAWAPHLGGYAGEDPETVTGENETYALVGAQARDALHFLARTGVDTDLTRALDAARQTQMSEPAP